MMFSLPTLALIAVLVFVTIAWFSRRPMTARVRNAAPGQFVKTPMGTLHYQFHGPPKGELVVLVHGLTTPSFYWADLLPHLTQAGYRVLTFDHFGRGFSDRPSATHNFEFYRQELDDLLGALNITQSFHLVGYSMGGGIATDYAAQRRDRLKSLTLIAPIGFLETTGSWVVRWPVIGDIAMFLFGGWSLRRAAAKAGVVEGVETKWTVLQARETRYAGFTTAVLSSLRNVIYVNLSKDHETIRARGLPLLAVFATDDTVIPIDGAMKLRELNRRAEIVEINSAGHSLVSTHAGDLGTAMTQFLRSCQDR